MITDYEALRIVASLAEAALGRRRRTVSQNAAINRVRALQRLSRHLVPGQTVTVHAAGAYDLCYLNEAGGTSHLPTGLYVVKVTRTFDDNETGVRCVGEYGDKTVYFGLSEVVEEK